MQRPLTKPERAARLAELAREELRLIDLLDRADRSFGSVAAANSDSIRHRLGVIYQEQDQLKGASHG